MNLTGVLGVGVLLLLGVSGCGDDASVAAPSETVVSLERQPCFGDCPVYTVAVDSEGNVSFDGKEFVQTMGHAEGTVTKEKLATLLETFQQADFQSLQDCYLPSRFGGGSICGQEDCSIWEFDSPTVITSFRINGVLKRVIDYQGCMVPARQTLSDIEAAVDLILDTCQWIGRDSFFCQSTSASR